MTTTKAPRAAIYASAKVAELKPKESSYGPNTFRVSMDIELKRPEPVLDFKGWKSRNTADWQLKQFIDGGVERFIRDNTTTEGEGDKAKEVKPKKDLIDARKVELAAEWDERQQGEYSKYVERASKDLQAAITGAMSSGMFMLLLGQKVDIRITPAQGQLFGPVFQALNPRGDVGQKVLAAASEPQPIDPDELDDEDDFDDEPGDDD